MRTLERLAVVLREHERFKRWMLSSSFPPPLRETCNDVCERETAVSRGGYSSLSVYRHNSVISVVRVVLLLSCIMIYFDGLKWLDV